jgi:tripartite-type tricarboxylate transporter receptor subunit TctC
VAQAPAVMVGRLNLPVRTLKELVELAAKEPGKLNFGSGGQGSSAHLAMEAFLLQNKIQLTHIPFKGIAPAMNDVAADRLDIAIGSIGSASALLKDKRLLGLAISGETRHPDLPEVPTFAQAGFPNYSMTYWFGMMAPANTPAEIIDRMQAAIAKAVTRQKVIEVFNGAGVTATSSTPQAFADRVTKETALWRAVIQEAKIKPE